MTRMTKIAITALLGLSILSTTAFADAGKGQKLYMKKMKAKCGFSGAKFAGMHTQDDWQEIKDAGKFTNEISKICPGVKVGDKYVPHIFDFAKEFASDSGNVPSC